MLNRCEFIGHMGKAAEIKEFDGGVKVATFSIGVSKKGYTTQSGRVVADSTTWVNIVAWRGLAGVIEKYTDKGSHLYVAGEMQIRSYEKDGVTRYVTEIMAETIELLSRKPEGNESANSTESQGVAPLSPDDLPF